MRIPHRLLHRLLHWLLLIALSLTFAACSGPGAERRARNVVLITIDTLRADHVGAYGGPVPTPAFDRLAQEGVLVEGACTPTPSTGPAHVSLMTGLHPWNHGILLNAVPMEGLEEPVLAEHFSAAGFETAAFVSSFNVDQRWGFGRGFEVFHFEPTETMKKRDFWSRGEATTDAALRWLESHSRERFFIWLHYFDPHAPYKPPGELAEADFGPVDLEGKELPPEVASLEKWVESIRAYRGEVAYTDAHVGRLIQGLQDRGILDQTAVVFTSDHGEGLGDHAHMGHGWNLYDELVTVPMIVRAPGLPAGQRLQGAAQLEDLMPTILSLAGLPHPADLDGFDLLGWLQGKESASPRPAVYGRRAAFPKEPELFFERRWPLKWIGEKAGPGRFYHLGRDRGEHTGAEAPEMSPALREAISRAVVPRERILDEESRKALEALGYL